MPYLIHIYICIAIAFICSFAVCRRICISFAPPALQLPSCRHRFALHLPLPLPFYQHCIAVFILYLLFISRRRPPARRRRRPAAPSSPPLHCTNRHCASSIALSAPARQPSGASLAIVLPCHQACHLPFPDSQTTATSLHFKQINSTVRGLAPCSLVNNWLQVIIIDLPLSGGLASASSANACFRPLP